MREEVLAPWFDRGVCVLQDYGLTEAMPVVSIVPLDDAHRLRATAGRPVAHCRVRIAAGDGSPVQAGEVGEVLVQGPTVMPEYWRNPEATREAFHRMAGCAPATSDRSTTTACCGSSTASST